MTSKLLIPPLLIIAGPTGSGKSAAALALARALEKNGTQVEMICADSITHYRGFDIGSAKPTRAERAEFTHHLLDICDPEADFTAGDFVRAAENAIAEIQHRGALPLLVGGSGFYLKALLRGMAVDENPDKKRAVRTALDQRLANEGAAALYNEMLGQDPALKARVHPNDTYRILRALEAMQLSGKSWSKANEAAEMSARDRFPGARLFCLEIDREILRERIARRTEAMLAAGLIGEVEALLRLGISPEAKPFLSIGYRQTLEYLGKIPPPENQSRPANKTELALAIARETMRLAKSQLTWFRGQKPAPEWVAAEPDPAAEILTRLASPPRL